MRTFLKRFLIGISVILVVSMGLVLFISLPKIIRERSLPAYARDLPSQYEEASAEFDRRIVDRFSLPMEETRLLSELKADGFSPTAGFKGAVLQQSAFPCVLEWTVLWTTDEKGAVTQLSGKFWPTCL